MRNTRHTVKLRSCQGFVLRHISCAEANALKAAPELGFDELEDGSLQKSSYQNDREQTPAMITPAEMRMNVGEFGNPKPESLRRDGYVDPIEAARDKIRVWPEIGDPKQSIIVEVFA